MDEEKRQRREAEKCWRVPSDPEGYLGQQVQRQPKGGRATLFLQERDFVSVISRMRIHFVI